jgi:lactate dehydrogenase-like 2-hydroxyacid dehydrogenase
MLIEIAHGLFNQHTVLDMLQRGKLYGYGVEAEPMTFATYEGNVWAAPAYAWATDSTMHNSMVKWIDNMISASKDEFPNRVN